MFKRDDITIREDVRPGDIDIIRSITSSSGFFYEEEIAIAVELVEERLAKGEKSGYYFLFADQGNQTVGYCTYGPIACTKSSYDLYWIAVQEGMRGGNIGSLLMDCAEMKIAGMGGTRVYVETSSRSLYEPTRRFYLARGYAMEAEIRDFYDRGDSKCIFIKEI